MSTTWKIILGIIIIGGIGWGASNMLRERQQVSTQPMQNTQANSATHNNAMSDTSDTALTADISRIDAHFDAVTQNSAQVDQSFNDKPVSQTE